MEDIIGHSVDISINNLTKSFVTSVQKRIVLDNIGLSILKGQTIGIFGRSGSGKSTLLAIIAGILSPDRGKVIVNGYEISAMSEKKRKVIRRKILGIIYQFDSLFPDLTALENIQRFLVYMGFDLKEINKLAHESLRLVSLESRGSYFPDDLSGGEKVRLSIARTLAKKPKIILADEPTGRLGDAYSYEIIQLLIDYARTNNSTLVCVTHRRDFKKYFDRSFELSRGRLKEL